MNFRPSVADKLILEQVDYSPPKIYETRALMLLKNTTNIGTWNVIIKSKLRRTHEVL